MVLGQFPARTPAVVDASTIHRRVRKFGPEIRKRAFGAHRSWRSRQWQVDETYVRVGGRWCCLWRAIYQFSQLIDIRQTARRSANPASVCLRQAQKTVRRYRLQTIVTDKAHSCAKVFRELNEGLGPEDAIRHVDRKYHARFQTMAEAKAVPAGIETFRTIRKGQFEECEAGVAN